MQESSLRLTLAKNAQPLPHPLQWRVSILLQGQFLETDAGNCTCSSQVCLPEHREQRSSVPGAWPVVGAEKELAVSMALAISLVEQPVGSSVLLGAAGSVPLLWVFS